MALFLLLCVCIHWWFLHYSEAYSAYMTGCEFVINIVKPYLVATSLIRSPQYSGHVK